MIKVVYDSAIDLQLPPDIISVALESEAITKAQVRDADILVVRSVTRVDADLIDASRLKLVASATAGVDHIDRAYLRRHGIDLLNTASANSRAVAEYALICMLLLAREHGFELERVRVAIIGFGNIGTRLYKLLGVIGCTVDVCDPFRDSDGSPAQLLGLDADGNRWVEFSQALKADVISFHVPLSHDGDHPTYHLLERGALKQLGKECCLINSARGAVHCTADLLDWVQQHPRQICLDVYEDEPNIDTGLLDACLCATGHVAGYTIEARARALSQVSRAVLTWLSRKQARTNMTIEPTMPTSSATAKTAADPVPNSQGAGVVASNGDLLSALLQCANPLADSACFCEQLYGAATSDIAKRFAGWRQRYLDKVARHEFSAWSYRVKDPLAATLARLGFASPTDDNI